METALVQILEGALLAAGDPLSVQRMTLLFEENERPSKDEIKTAIKSVEERCEGRGYELVKVASGYRFQVRQDLAQWVGRLWQERPAMYATTRQFLDYFNLKSLDQLPPLAEIKELDNLSGELSLENPQSEGGNSGDISVHAGAGGYDLSAVSEVDTATISEPEGTSSVEQRADDGEESNTVG